MNAQEIFDKALFGMIEQGRLGSTEGRTCLYRDDAGLCCGVGLLVSAQQAKVWDARKDSSAIGDLALEPRFPKHLKDHVDLLEEIQLIHDCAVTHDGGLPEYVTAFRSLAAQRHLVMDMTRIPQHLLTN